MVQLTVSKTGETVDVSKGETFEISLPESPATGFRWKITANGEPVSRMTVEEFRPGQGWEAREFDTGNSAPCGPAKLTSIWSCSDHGARPLIGPDLYSAGGCAP